MRRDTILVVDDTPETLGFLTDTLDHAGFTVLIATDGESALRLIEQITPDLVLMDAVMPGLNGFETCRRMKRNKMLGAPAGDLHDGAHRNRKRARGTGRRRRRLRHQAAGRRRTAGAHPRASRQCARRARARAPRSMPPAVSCWPPIASGRLLWCTPKARQLLAELFPSASDHDASLPGAMMGQLMQLRSEGSNTAVVSRRQRPQGGDLRAEPHRPG